MADCNSIILSLEPPVNICPNTIVGGEFEITATLGNLSYTIPIASNFTYYSITEKENSLGGGYYSSFISKKISGTGIQITYPVQPPVGQKIKFEYLLIA